MCHYKVFKFLSHTKGHILLTIFKDVILSIKSFLGSFLVYLNFSKNYRPLQYYFGCQHLIYPVHATLYQGIKTHQHSLQVPFLGVFQSHFFHLFVSSLFQLCLSTIRLFLHFLQEDLFFVANLLIQMPTTQYQINIFLSGIRLRFKLLKTYEKHPSFSSRGFQQVVGTSQGPNLKIDPLSKLLNQPSTTSLSGVEIHNQYKTVDIWFFQFRDIIKFIHINFGLPL